jgi:hypothetical protein
MPDTEWSWTTSDMARRTLNDVELRVAKLGAVIAWSAIRGDKSFFGKTKSITAGKIAAEAAAVKLQNSR